MAERWGLCPDHESVVDPITGRASATCQCRPVTAPDPTLADAIDGWAEADESNKLLYSFVSAATTLSKRAADLRAAAVRLREQDAEIALLKARIDHDREVIHGYSVRVDKLDRIEAASGDDVEWSVALAVCRELAVRYPSWASDLGITEALLRRLADALEDPGTDG